MSLSRAQLDSAVTYNRARTYDSELIRAVQTLLRVSVDGDLGPKSTEAIARFQAEEELDVDGKLGEGTLDVMEEIWRTEERDAEGEDDEDVDEDTAPSDPTDPASYGFVELFDLRRAERKKTRGRPKRRRKWSIVNGIVLHQTACVFSGPKHRGVINVPAHAMTFTKGEVALLNDPDKYMAHAHGFNRRTVGIEVSAHACGLEGVFTPSRSAKGDNTFWRSVRYPDAQPVEATDVQLEATRKLVRYYIALVAAHGGKIEYVYAHRQSAAKLADPGSRIWKAVGIWAQDELGLRNGPRAGYCIGKGQPIPSCWDPRIEGVPYSWKYKGC